jgi:hypothetical protein
MSAIRYLSYVNKRPGQIKVTVETGFCSFCDRTRNLRHEERHLGALVRTVTSCESCHRVLSSTIGVAEPEAAIETASAPASAKPEPAAAAAPPERVTVPKSKAAVTKPKTVAAKAKAPAKRAQTSK